MNDIRDNSISDNNINDINDDRISKNIKSDASSARPKADGFTEDDTDSSRKKSVAGSSGKKKAAAIIIVIVLLVAAIAVLVRLNDTGIKTEPETLTVMCDGKISSVFTLGELQALQYTDIKKHISSGQNEDEDGTFRGPELKAVLEAAGIKLDGSEDSITVRSEDGYTAAFEPEEVMADECVLLVYQKDGELLKSRDEGGNGPFRIIAVDDSFGTRCSKYVNIIEVES